MSKRIGTYLLLLFIEVVDDDTNEQVEREEGAKNDEEDEVQVHVDVHLVDGLLTDLVNNGFLLGC